MPRTTKRERLQKEFNEQLAWMEERGTTKAGYVKFYGSKDDADHHGDGGEAIWEADYGALKMLASQLKINR